LVPCVKQGTFFIMSKPNIAGLIAAVVVIVSAFLPWLSIESKHLVFTGVQTVGSSFGEPGKVNVFLAVLAGVLFFVERKWSARLNLFVTAFLSAWAFRNFLIFSRCEMGECPDREIGLYLSLIFGLVTFICVLLANGKRPLPAKDQL
jgi:hypothetical protein